MKEHYPARATVPQDWLVPPELQPDFFWERDEQTRSEHNVGRESIDHWCERGYGEKPAVVWMTTGEVVTFQELKEKSDRLAGALIELGVEVGDRLALRYSSQPAAIIAAVAAWKAGAAVVPIPASAGGHRDGHHSLKCAGHPLRAQGGPGARCWLHTHCEAGRGGGAGDPAACSAAGGGGAACRSRQHRYGRCASYR